MGAYDFLSGVTVVEIAQLGPDALGGHLADMGADVIKVEALPDGDILRGAEAYNIGGADAAGFLHLRWNRGKRSIALDLKSPEALEFIKAMASSADVVIEGMRAGYLDRLDLSYDTLKRANPKLVFCSLSGLGGTGPYSALGSHAPSYDAWGGLDLDEHGNAGKTAHHHPKRPLIGVNAAGLYAAVAVLAAIIKAQRTKEGSFVEVSAADCAAHWQPDSLDRVLNAGNVYARAGFFDEGAEKWKISKWPRMDYYRTADQRVLFVQLRTDKFWRRFCEVVNREDLLEADAKWQDVEERNRYLAHELTNLMHQRSLADWMSLFQTERLPATPVNSLEELTRDPHFLARDNVYEISSPAAGRLRLTSSPIKVAGQALRPNLAPDLGADTDVILSEKLGVSRERLADLRKRGVVG